MGLSGNGHVAPIKLLLPTASAPLSPRKTRCFSVYSTPFFSTVMSLRRGNFQPSLKQKQKVKKQTIRKKQKTFRIPCIRMSVLYGFTWCRKNRAENLCKFLTDINYFCYILFSNYFNIFCLLGKNCSLQLKHIFFNY